MPPTAVTRTYLEMRSPVELVSAGEPPSGSRIERLGSCPPSFYRYLYAEVGRAYQWTDRLAWSNEQIAAHLSGGDVDLYVLYVDHAPAGYFELRQHDDGSIELAYFGLLPEFTGRRLGGWLLTEAVRAAWSRRPPRVWVHTCTLDHPAALPNYRKRGFREYHQETFQV